MIVGFFVFVGCIDSEKNLAVTSSPPTPIRSSPTPELSPTPATPEAPALVKTVLEFYRNGKTYEVIVGYELGRAFFRATPHPEAPDKEGIGRGWAKLEWYGDIDKDGEVEFIVSIGSCGSYCVDLIQIYEYDPATDNYYVADEFGAKSPAIQNYTDLNNDGNPELIAGNYGFCFQCSAAVNAFAAISIMRYENGEFKDVAREFPELLEQDALQHLETVSVLDNQHIGFIVLASYLYDMYRLGKMEEGLMVFDQICVPEMMPSVLTCEDYRIEIKDVIESREN